jgi:hypothetical protein
MKRQHWIIIIAIFALASFSCAGNAHRQKIRLIKAGDSFPETPLPIPPDPRSQKYLGVSGENNFTLKAVGADLIVVEILSVHCPSCQRQSKAYNKLYDLIEQDPQTRDRIKMIGIAAGNSWAEVTHFIAQYNVRFPIIPDPQYHFYNAIGETRAPFTIYVRQQPGMPAAIVAKTHFGLNLQYMEVFDELKQILTLDVASIQNANSKKVAVQPIVKPVITKAELEARIKKLFADFGNPIGPIKKVMLKSARNVYTGLVDHNGARLRLFAEAVSRPPVCIDCHDVHFIYAFDPAGRVIGFEPIQLTKYGNEPWDPDDVSKMRSRIIGRTLSESITFQPDVDAVSSATITSGIIFNSLSSGRRLLDELKAKGLI